MKKLCVSVELCLNEYRWDAHIVHPPMDLQRRNIDGGKKMCVYMSVTFQTKLQLEQQEHKQKQSVLRDSKKQNSDLRNFLFTLS